MSKNGDGSKIGFIFFMQIILFPFLCEIWPAHVSARFTKNKTIKQ